MRTKLCFGVAVLAEVLCFCSTGSHLMSIAYGITVYGAMQTLKFGRAE